VFAYRLLERDEGIGLAKGADLPGAALITSGLMLLIYTIIEAADYGWGSTRTLVLAGIGLALLAGFVLRQATARTPLAPLRIFRNRNVSGANVIQVLMVAGMYGVFFLGALYMQGVLGYGAVEVGLAFLPVAALIGVFSIGITDRIVVRYGARTALVPGLLLVGAGLLLFTQVPVNGDYVADMLPTMILLGVGAGLVFPSVVALAMSSATPEDAGLASGLTNTTLQVGGALGLAILASLSTTRTENLLADGASQASALVDGYQLAYFVAVGFLAAAVALAISVLKPVAAPEEADVTELDVDDREPAYSEAA
jgi:predicted MFS family arabinose efflux permease